MSHNVEDWSSCETWLAKPPLALWFMALSMKIFGVNEIALRLPSLIFSTLTIYIVYLIGRKLYSNNVGLMSAFFYSINGILYEINIGLLSGDHVDTLFHLLFHISIYALISKNTFSSIKIGIFIGCIVGFAFLTKWIMAFFIIFVGTIYIIYVRKDIIQLLKFLSSLTLAFVIISFPWLCWIFRQFPIEANLILKGMFSPITSVVQEHNGSILYYLDSIRINVNELVYLPIIFLVVKFITRMTKERFLLLSWIMIPLVLLSLSSTKREVYILMAATPLFISISVFILYLNQIKFKYVKYSVFIIILQSLFYIAAVRYSVERVKPWNARLTKPDYRLEIENLIHNSNVPSDSIVIVNERYYIDARFYYNVIGYRYVNDSIINTIKSKNYKVYKNVDGKYFLVD